MDLMNVAVLMPEMVMLGMACAIALLDLFVNDSQRRLTYGLAQATLAVVALLHAWALQKGLTQFAMQSMVVSDALGHLLSLCATVAVMIAWAYSRTYIAVREMLKGEFFTLSMFALLGINLMISAQHFLVIYLGLELMSLSTYALVALRRDHAAATEAAMKYFVLGALASGFLLYGLSMLYGATGTLEIGRVVQIIDSGLLNRQILIFGLVFVVAGLGFKLAAAPFHMWVPDVYQGAPTAVTLLIAGAPKLAAFAVAFRLLVQGFAALAFDWQQMFIVLALVSLVIGNLAAIAQSNLKRMLAYSTIGQIGFMLLGFVPIAASLNAVAASHTYSVALFYLLIYVLTTLGSFGAIAYWASQGFEAEMLDDWAGMAKTQPWLAATMAVFMFSLAGIPPTVGFYAKLAVLEGLVSTNSAAYMVLATAAVLLSLVAAFYYLRVVKMMYFDEASDTDLVSRTIQPWNFKVLLICNATAVLALGLLPGGLMNICRDVILRTLVV